MATKKVWSAWLLSDYCLFVFVSACYIMVCILYGLPTCVSSLMLPDYQSVHHIYEPASVLLFLLVSGLLCLNMCLKVFLLVCPLACGLVSACMTDYLLAWLVVCLSLCMFVWLSSGASTLSTSACQYGYVCLCACLRLLASIFSTLSSVRYLCCCLPSACALTWWCGCVYLPAHIPVCLRLCKILCGFTCACLD